MKEDAVGSGETQDLERKVLLLRDMVSTLEISVRMMNLTGDLIVEKDPQKQAQIKKEHDSLKEEYDIRFASEAERFSQTYNKPLPAENEPQK